MIGLSYLEFSHLFSRKKGIFALLSVIMEKIVNFLVVGLGGAIGSMLRYGVTLLGMTLHISGNITTFTVNILGSFLIGVLSGCSRDCLQLLLTVGLCGGFTTFSTFSMQNVRMIQDGKIGMAAVYAVSTVLVCIAMAWLGYRTANRFLC